ncbi:type IV pilus biogenesis/stability protein PilW [Vibrio sp. JC009]|uniref:type IV pilus biogenesis/stability protein PilW n=1 Tax=Vibrio sp. JC009 TaxID=2912314 RepID=UPI0023AF1795|nr:type IV pilus biogenesis/stability protein PilW [Vibrio sp. JC009]WED21344.1 type IV pilus biogenesis/stability protein PilW [Vibrio sp. JC009]
MKRCITSTFLACLLVGCVTVSGQKENGQFDAVKAADARIVLGLRYFQSGDLIRARENLELAVKYAPDYYRSLNSLAFFYEQIKEYDLAGKAYRKALRKSPQNGDVLNNYGAFLCKRGQYQKADEYFNRAIEQPDYYLTSHSYENAAMCALKSNDINKAEYYFKRSLDHEPGRYKSLIRLSRLEAERGEHQQARDRLIRFHNKFGYKPESLGLLIELEQQAGNKSLVQEYTETLKRYYPDYSDLEVHSG